MNKAVYKNLLQTHWSHPSYWVGALDAESEKIIQAAMPKIIGKHTAVVIAHRLSTIAGLDRILVMHDGQVIESGTHSELLALGGRYASLWKKQAE